MDDTAQGSEILGTMPTNASHQGMLAGVTPDEKHFISFDPDDNVMHDERWLTEMI